MNKATSAALAGVLTAATVASAQNIQKADNTDPLNQTASWVQSAVPGAANTAVWDSTDQTGLSVALGASMTWGGLEILNPGGAITIPSDGNALTISNYGINMSQASVGLTLDNTVTLAAPQQWQIGNGQTLTINGGLYLTATGGGLIRFNFDSNPGSEAFIAPLATGSYVNLNNTVLATNNGTGPTTLFATYNDVDYAALNSGNQVVGGASIVVSGTPLYTTNANGSTPSIGSSSTTPLVWDVVNTNSYGINVRGSYAVDAMRFNTPQTAPYVPGGNVYTYLGVPSWSIAMKGGSTLSVNSILMTTNLGASAVVVQSGGTFRAYGVSGTYIPNEFFMIQNNPASSFVVQSPFSAREGGTILNKTGVGIMEMQAALGANWGTILIYGGTILIDGAGTVGSSPVSVFSGANFEGATGAASAAPVTVNNGGTNTAYVTSASATFANNTNLTFNAGATALQFLYSNSIAPGSTAPLTIANAPLSASNTVTVNVLCGSLSTGQFPLVKYAAAQPLNLGTNTFAGVFNLAEYAPHAAASLVNDTASNSIDLLVTSVDQPMYWTASAGTWDVNDSANQVWQDSGNNPEYYEQNGPVGDNVVFSDAASGSSPVVTLNTTVTPSSVTNNSTKNYTISGTGGINGTGSFTKMGSSTLTMGSTITNLFSGGLYLDAGVLSFKALNNLGARGWNNVGPGTITFNGGALQWNSDPNTADISSLPTLFASGGATLDTDGNNVIFTNAVGGGGAGGLTKVGAGSLTLGGTNTYTGATVVSAGTLALGAGAALPSSSISVSSTATFDASALTGFTLGASASQTLSGTGTVLGSITNGANGTISVAGSPLSIANLTVGAGTLVMAIAEGNSDLISVPGTLTFNPGTGKLQLTVTGSLTNGTYPLITFGAFSGSAGNLQILGVPAGHQAILSASGSRINLVVSSVPNVVLVWSGNSSTWDTGTTADWLINGNPADTSVFAVGDTADFNDVGQGNSTVYLTGAIQPSVVNVSVTNVSYTFAGTGNLTGGSTELVYNSSASGGGTTLQIDTPNINGGGAYIGSSLCTLQVGNGSTTGCYLGTSGNITNNGSLIFDQPDSQPAELGTISGSGSLTQEGQGTLTLAANNTYTGGTAITSGTLQLGNGVATGSVTGAIADNGALVFDNGGTLTAGNRITGSGTVTFGGSGTVIFSGNNDYYGNTTVTNGTVQLGSATAIPDYTGDANATGVLTVNGGTFDLAGLNVTVNALAGTTATPLPLVTNSGLTGINTLTLNNTSASSTYSGQIAENPTGAKLALVTYESSFTLDGPATLSGGITVEPNATLALTGNGTAYTGPITLDNNTTFSMATSSAATFPVNAITIANGATATFTSGSTGNALEGPIIGGATSTNIINSSMSAGATTNEWNSFYGTVVIAQAGQLRFGNTGAALTNGGTNAIWDIEGEVDVRNTGMVELGALVGSSSGLIGIDSPTVSGEGTFVIGFLNSSTIYSSTFGGNNNLIKVGTGTLTLNGTVDYAGNTTVSNGTLAIAGGSASLDYNTNITVVTGSTLDVSGLSPATLNLGNLGSQTQTLAGGGTVNGAINALANFSIIAPGDSTNATGNLTATGAVTIAGAVQMKLDATNALTSDRITAPSITVQPGATSLVVTNIGPANFTYGQTFQLFSTSVSAAFDSVTLPSLGSCANLAWVNNLTVNGTISVGGAPCVNTTATNITYQLNGQAPNQTLTLSWPSNQTGWTLQAQTNASGGINPNPGAWVNVAGSTNVNSVTIPIVSTDRDVFYRLVYYP